MANVRVALRVRPLSKRENAEGARIIVNVDEKIARIRNIKLDYKPESCGDTRERLLEFGFDYCYWSVDPEDPKYASQEVVFQDLGTTVLSEAIKGYNVCLFAYGQTGSGKTFTMMGTPASIGLTPRICEGLFSYNDGSPGTPSSSRIEVSFLEIYNERVRDLLHQSEQKKPYTLRVREHPHQGPYVQGLSQHVVTDYEQVVALLEQGMENRITAATHVHDASSRSHAIFTIHYTQAMLEDNLPSEIASKINLVDLAGSERASPNYCKDRLTEGSNINRSLVTLGIVISALAQNSQMTSSCQSINSILSDGDSGIPGSPSGSSTTGSKRQPFVPYRDSILTWLLKDSLGGNSKTIMIATVSPASSSYNETMSTLRYASNAKNIINKPRVNEDANVKLIRELREEINRLKAMLRNFEMRTISPFSEERDGNLTELVLQNELKIEQLTKDWTDKWTDKAALMEQYSVDINEGKARVTIDSGLPHLIAMDDDILSTGVVIYYLREGTTDIGSGDQDIVLQGENILQDHCKIENKFGEVELQPSLGGLCTVNGQEVKEVCRLSQGAIVVLGKCHRFRFNHPAEAAVLRQMRSDSQASFVSDCSLDWLDLSGDFSSSSKGNSLILNTRNSESPSDEYQQGFRKSEETYRKQIEEQKKYVEDLKSQIQTAQLKEEKELEQEQSLINQQIQENETWLVKEKERLGALCQQKRESSSQTEPKTYVEVEVQNCLRTDIQPSLEEQEGKKLVQLELLRKCSLRKAERNIRRKRVKLQLERIVKKQKLLEAKKTLQQLQAACWLSDDIVKPLLHVPKVQDTSFNAPALHRSSSSPSGFSVYRRCSLPWSLPTLPNSYSAVLKRKCKSELAHTFKTDEVRNPLRSVSIDCLLSSSSNPSSNAQLEINPPNISTKNLQFVEEQKIDLLIKQIAAGAALSSGDPQMSKKRQKMDKSRGGSKGSSNNVTAEQPKRRNIRPTVSTGTKDTRLKPLKCLSPLTVGGPKKSTVPEKSKISPKSDVGKLPPQKSVKHTQISPGTVKPPSGESTLKGKPSRPNMASIKLNTQRKPAEQTNKISSSVDMSKISNRRGETQTSDRSRISTERLNRVLLKSNIQTLGDCRRDDHTDTSDSESFYSIDSLSSAYASALTEQLKQEELQRQRHNFGQKDSDSEDSQMSQDSLAEKDKRKERPNKRRFNKYKTIGATSATTTSFTGDPNSFPLVTTGSVTTGLTKSFSLDSLADAEDVLEVDSADELPAEIFWKLQSPRSLIVNEEEQNKENIAAGRKESDLDISNSFYLKVNGGDAPEYCNTTLHEKIEQHPAFLSDTCDEKSQAIFPVCDSTCSSSSLSSQADDLKANTGHGGTLSPACAPTLESQVRVDEINHLCTEIGLKAFPSQLEASHIKSVIQAYDHSVPYTETKDRPVNTCTVKSSEMMQEVKGQEQCPLDCNYLDRRCSIDIDTPCHCQNKLPNIQESSSDVTRCKIIMPFSESKDVIAASPVTCTKIEAFKKEMQGENEQVNVESLTFPIPSLNTNEFSNNLCSPEMCNTSLNQMKICESILHVPVTQENVHPNNIMAETISDNTNDVMPISLHAQLENLNNQQQNIPPHCQESDLSGPLCYESIPKRQSMDHFNDDQQICCQSNSIQLLPQSQRSTVEPEINVKTAFKAEEQTDPMQEAKMISEPDDEQSSVQKHDPCEHGNIFSTGNTNGRPNDCTEDKSFPTMERKIHRARTHIPLPVQHSSLHQHRRSLTLSCVPGSQQGNVKDKYIYSRNQESVPDPCKKNTETHVKPNHKSETAAVIAIDPSPVTTIANHPVNDVAAECNSLILPKNVEGLCFTMQDDSLNKHCHIDDIAEKSSSAVFVAVTLSSKHQDTETWISDVDTRLKNNKEKDCPSLNEETLIKNNMSSNSDGESPYASAKTCSTCNPIGSPESQNTIETSDLLCSECTSNKNQSNEVLHKSYPNQIQHSHVTDQPARSDGKMAAHNHVLDAGEASKQVHNSSTINTKASNRDLSQYDNTQSQILKEESPEMSFNTYPFCLNKNISLKHATLRNLKDINSNDKGSVLTHESDCSTEDFLSESGQWKPYSGLENSIELEYAAEGSSTGSQQDRVASAHPDVIATCQPLPYYEAKMQNKPLTKLQYQNEIRDKAMFSDNMESSKGLFSAKQAGLHIRSPSSSGVKEAVVIDGVTKVETGLKCTEEGRIGYNHQHEDPELLSSNRGRDCNMVSQSTDANSMFSFVMPRQYNGSQDIEELNGATSSMSTISKCSYLQSRSESTGEDPNSDTNSVDRTQENSSVQQSTYMCDAVLKANEGEYKSRIRDASLHKYKSALCTAEEGYTNLMSNNTPNLSITTSISSPICNVMFDTFQVANADYLNKNDRPQDQDKKCTSNHNVDSEMIALYRDESNSGLGIEEKMYPPICRSSPHDVSIDEVNEECNADMTADLYNCITNSKACKVECEPRPIRDQNIPLLTHSNRVNDGVNSAVEDYDSSKRIGDRGYGGLEEKSTGVCGEYFSDLSESADLSSSDTDTSKYLVLKKVIGFPNSLVDVLTNRESYSSVSIEAINEMSQSAHSNEETSSCTDSIKTPSPEDLDDPESKLNELSLDRPAVSITPSHAEALLDGTLMPEHIGLSMKSEEHAQNNEADHYTHKGQPLYPTTMDSALTEGVDNKAYLKYKLPGEHPSNLIPEPLNQVEQSTDVVDNTEGLHFSSSDINPFVHSWQQEDCLKPGRRNCTFKSASDVSCAIVREQADKLMRCSSVDEGLNSHNSPFHSHLSSYANAKMVSSTISSLGRNDSRPDINSLNDSQELLSDESAGISGLQTKLEDYSQLDEIIFLYTSESETCNEPVKRVSGDQGVQMKHKYRKSSKHQRNHTDMPSSRQMRNRNVCQRPASWSSVQNMSLHLSQLLQETSELLGNLSKHNPQNISKDAIEMQRSLEDQIIKREVRDSSTQTSEDKSIQTDSRRVNNAQNPRREHNHFLSSPGINVIVKVLGTDSLTQIPQNAGVSEQNRSKVTKTRTQSLPNLHEFEPCKQSDHILDRSPQVSASIPFLTGFKDTSSTPYHYSSSKSSSVSTNVNKCAEDTVVNSPSTSVVDTTRYQTSYHDKTEMVDRASSPILTVKASRKFHHKLVPDNHLSNQNFAKILRNRKRKERTLRDPQLNSSLTETDSESNAGNGYDAIRSSSLKETTRRTASTAKFQRFVSEGCILRDTRSSFTNHSSNSEITGNGTRCNGANYFTSTQSEKAPHPWEHLQSLQNLSLMSQPLTQQDRQIPQCAKEFGSDQNDHGSFTITSGNSYIKNRSYPYSPSQMSGFGLQLQEDGLSVVESECNTDILLGQEPSLRPIQTPHSYALQELPMHNKFSNWSGVQCGATKNTMVSSSPNLHVEGSPTKTDGSQTVLDSRSQEIERLQRERVEVLSAIHLEMNPVPLTVQLAEAKLSYGIGETDALLRVIQTGKMDPQDTISIKKQLYERHLKVIANLRKEREERLQICRRSRSLSPQKQLSASQTSLTSLRESDLPSRRREYLQQLRRDVVDNTRIQEPKTRAPQCPSDIEVMLKDYQKAREEAKTEIAKARDKLRERAEMERKRLQQGSLTKEDSKTKTLVSTSTLFTNSSLSLSSGPTSGYNSGMTTTIGQCSKLSSQETLLRSLDPALGSGRGRSAVRNSDLFTPTSVSAPDSKRMNFLSTVESLPGKSVPCTPQCDSPLQSTVVSYQELATQVQTSAMAEVMSACTYDIKKLYNRQAEAGWIYQSTEKDVLVYYKAFSSPTKHGFIGAGVIRRPLQDVWCMVKDVSTRRLYDKSILTTCVHERVSSHIQLVHVMTDTSLCYLKQPRDFCCMAVEFEQEKCCSLCFQSVYNKSMPRPSKDTVRGELLPSAWILRPDMINGEAVTRVIYMIQVDLGAPAIPSRLLSVISKRQPLVIANLASFMSR